MTPHYQPPSDESIANNNDSIHQKPIDLSNSHMPNAAVSTLTMHNPQNQTILEQQTVDNIISLSNQHPAPPHTHNNTKKRERRTLSNKLISQLNQAFSLYKNQPPSQHFYLKSLAHFLKIGYSTVLRKYCEFKVSSHVDQGKRLSGYPKEYNKGRLARCLISRTLNERHFQNAREISRFVFGRYGLYYDVSLINKQLRRMGINKGKNKDYHVQKGAREYLCDQCLLQSLIKMEATMVYFSQYLLSFHYDQEVTVMLLASKFGATVKIIHGKSTYDDFTGLTKQFWTQNYSLFGDIWYLIMRKEDFYCNQPAFSKKNDKIVNCFLNDPKMVFFGGACIGISPAYHLLTQIMTKIHQSQLSLSQLLRAVPQWLQTQRDSACKFIEQAELYVCNQGHSCPV